PEARLRAVGTIAAPRSISQVDLGLEANRAAVTASLAGRSGHGSLVRGRLPGERRTVELRLDDDFHGIAHTHGRAGRRNAEIHSEVRPLDRAVRGKADARIRVKRMASVTAVP